MKHQIDPETLAALRAINEAGAIFDACISTAHGDYHLKFDREVEENNWYLDVTSQVTAGVAV